MPNEIIPASVLRPDLQQRLSTLLTANLPDERPNEIYDRLGKITNTERVLIAYLIHLRTNPAGTRRQYFSTIFEFFQFTQTPVEKISSVHIDDWLFHQKAIKKNKPVTIKGKLDRIKAFFGFLTDTGLIRLNPAKIVKGPRYPEEDVSRRVLRDHQITTMLSESAKNETFRNFLIVSTLFWCGLRSSECSGLKWGDFYYDVQNRPFFSILGKGEKRREVYVPEELKKHLLYWRQMLFNILPEEDAPGIVSLPIFFPKKNLTEHLSAQSILKITIRLCENTLGKRIRPRDLRHTHATHARILGATLEQLREQLGHALITTTMKYNQSANLSDPAGKVLENHFLSAADDAVSED